MPSAIPPKDFPDYSVQLYALPDVPRACLTLQDELGLDVNLVLWCLFAGARGTPLDEDRIAAADAAAATWRDNVVVHLRQVRRWMKGRDEEVEVLRQALIAQEIQCELHEQRLISRAVPLAAGPASAWTGAANLAAYLRWCGLTPTVAATHAIQTLLERAFPRECRAAAGTAAPMPRQPD